MSAKPAPKSNPPMSLRADPRRLKMQIHLGEIMQREDADHADDDCRHHDLHDREVLEQQLTEQDVVFAHAALLQKEAEREAEENRADQLRTAHRALRRLAGLLHCFAGIDHSDGEEQHGGGNAADEHADDGEPRTGVELKRAADPVAARATAREPRAKGHQHTASKADDATKQQCCRRNDRATSGAAIHCESRRPSTPQ